MAYQTLTRTLTNTAVAVDTFVSLTAQGGSSNLSSNIPNGVSKLVKVDLAIAGDITPRVTALRIQGQGLSKSQVLTGTGFSGVTSGVASQQISIPCDFDVSANASFDIQFMQMSAGAETMTVSVTCYFA